MIWAHDESRDTFGEGAKWAIWICRIRDISKKMFFANGMALVKCADGFVGT